MVSVPGVIWNEILTRAPGPAMQSRTYSGRRFFLRKAILQYHLRATRTMLWLSGGWWIFYEIILWNGYGSGHFVNKMISHLKGTAGGDLQLVIWHSFQKPCQMTPAEVLAHQILNGFTSFSPQYQMLWCLHQTLNYVWAASKQKFS